MCTWTKLTLVSVSARTGNQFEFKFTNSRKRWGGRFEYQPNPPQGAPLAGFRAYPHTKPPLLLAASYSCMSGCLGGCCGPKEVHGGHHPTLGGTGDIQGDGWWPRGALGGPQWSGKAYFALFADLLPAFVLVSILIWQRVRASPPSFFCRIRPLGALGRLLAAELDDAFERALFMPHLPLLAYPSFVLSTAERLAGLVMAWLVVSGLRPNVTRAGNAPQYDESSAPAC